jgi:molybdenum cofactor biosynthesis enzyme MoaA
MMRFPLRLTAELALARIARKVRHATDVRPVHFVDAAEILHQDSSHPVSHERIRGIVSCGSPIVWIGGREPLDHPGISHLVRAITHTGHFVFLETDGTLLRRRIHEFQPVSRLFLTVRLEAAAQRRTSAGLPESTLALAAEGIRAARLSGFLVCVNARVHAEAELREIADLMQFARSQDVDGIVVSPEHGGLKSAKSEAEALQRKTAEAREMIGSKWWESFSRVVEPVVSGERHTEPSGKETGVRLDQETDANEEGVRIA